MTSLTSVEAPTTDKLHRNLSEIQLIFIAIGGTIGTGLFVGSGVAIAMSGVGGSLVAFTVLGAFVYLIMTSLAELAALHPVSGSFSTYASVFIDPALGFAVGWNYYIQWALSLPSELAAAAIVLEYWAPNVSSIIWMSLCLALVVACNLTTNAFGHTEYWLSIVKISAICLFLVVSLLLSTGVLSGSTQHGFANWMGKNADELFKNGIRGLFQAFVFAFFAFGGTELVGIAAGESLNPQISIPKAIKGTFWRICLFYILSIFMLGLLLDPTQTSSSSSDDISIAAFTLVFKQAGIPVASHMMNFVILVAVLSAANSSLFASSRTLMSLAIEKKAPRIFARLDGRGVPIYAILVSIMVACLCFFGILLGNGVVFTYLVTFSSMSGLLTWLCISITHLRFRSALTNNQRDRLPYRAPWFPFAPILALIIGSGVGVGQVYLCFTDVEMTMALKVLTVGGIPIFWLLFLVWKLCKSTQNVPLEKIQEFVEMRINEIESSSANSRLVQKGTLEKV